MTDTFVFIIASVVLGAVLAAYAIGFDVIAWVGAPLLRASGLQ